MALDRGDADRALEAARLLRKFQGREDLPFGTALRLTVLLSQKRHPLSGPARRRSIERAQAELTDWQLAVIAEAALDGLDEQVISEACARILLALAQGHEWTPVPASRR